MVLASAVMRGSLPWTSNILIVFRGEGECLLIVSALARTMAIGDCNGYAKIKGKPKMSTLCMYGSYFVLQCHPHARGFCACRHNVAMPLEIVISRSRGLEVVIAFHLRFQGFTVACAGRPELGPGDENEAAAGTRSSVPRPNRFVIESKVFIHRLTTG
jgi:hypothetical protein